MEVGRSSGAAAEKMAALEEAGVVVAKSPADIGQALKTALERRR
jgi:succinyl-CoA synthetase alpha subunit